MHTDMSRSYRFTVLGLGFCVFTRASLFVLKLVILSLVYFSLLLFLVVSISAIDCLERLVSEMTCYVSSGTLNPTHSPHPQTIVSK